MRILVTGSRGVIGQNLVPRLEAAGHKVIEFDIARDPSMDVRSAEAVENAISHSAPALVIHMAAQVGRINGENDPRLSIESNMVGTLNVARSCANHGVRLVNFSTSEVYGHNSVFGTPDILEQNGMYGLTKLGAEGIVKHYCDTGGLQAVSIRPFMVYGPHEVPNGVFRSAISNFIDTAMRGGVISAHEGCVRSWCYADDFVDGLMLVIDRHDFSTYDSLCIGTDEYRSMEEAARIVIETVGRGSYVVEPVPPFYVSAVKKADFAKLKALGFEQRVDLEEGVRRTYGWMVSR